MLIVLIVLYVASQLGSTLIATASADPNQRRLMLLLPVVFVVILFRYPAGLLVYWITTNVWTIGQQSIIRRRLPPPPPRPAKNGVDATGNPEVRCSRCSRRAATDARGAVAGGSAVGGLGERRGRLRRDPERAPTATAAQEEETIREA